MSTLDRRQFTLLPLLAAPLLARGVRAASSASPHAQFPPPPRPESLKLAARVSPEGSEVDLATRLAELRGAGFDGVEVIWPGPYRPDRVRSAAEQAECPVHAVRVSEAFGAALSVDDDDLRAQGIERLEKALRLAADLGATSLSLVPGSITAQVSDERAWNRVKIALQAVLPLAIELDVRIALRLGQGDFLGAPLEAARFIDELDSPGLGWQLDTAWSFVRSFPQHWAHILGGRLVKVDLADFSRAAARNGGLSRGFEVELGQGDLDAPAVLEALAHALYSGWVTVEAHETTQDALAERAARAREWLAQ